MRPLPGWYDDAKLGIFVHWYPASVPAFAPLSEDPFTIAERGDWGEAMRNTPYAEWYWNSLALGDTPVARHHAEVWGGRPYADFVPLWQEAVRDWHPDPMAELFVRSGARYVVHGTKHHDGVLLWPSAVPNPHRPDWDAGRDLVGPLVDAVRDRGLRVGLYYSGGLDWTFAGPGAPVEPAGMADFAGMIAAIPRSPEYAAYVHAHWEELIERYRPDVLWNDIAHPPAGSYRDLVAAYYERVPDGVVNDRFDVIGARRGTFDADFLTPEYRIDAPVPGRKFEVCRGIGRSFGYNRLERDEDFLRPDQLVWDLVEIVSHGGNLLLNVGPTARGEIPFAQRLRLEALGTWLAVHGDAIYGTRPGSGGPVEGQRVEGQRVEGQRVEGETGEGAPVRFTHTPTTGASHAIVRGATAAPTVVVIGWSVPEGAVVQLAGARPGAGSLAWTPVEAGADGRPAVRVELPCPAPDGPAFVLSATLPAGR
jgi:alpha-L-fucosidase